MTRFPAFDPIDHTLDPALPIYERIRRSLEHQIVSGAFEVGEQLPSEAELQRIYNASRTPIRQALQALENQGLIYRAQGRGSFVRDRQRAGATHDVVSFRQELIEAGHTVDARILSVTSVTADETVANYLHLEVDTPVIALRRQFIVDGEPLVVFTHHLLPVLELEYLRREGHFPSLFTLLEQAGYKISETSESIGARLLEEDEAALLGVDLPAAALLIRQTAYVASGAPLVVSRYLLRADRYERVHLRKFLDQG